MKTLRNLIFLLFGIFLSTPLCYAIAGPAAEIATEAKLPTFTRLTDVGTEKGLISESLKMATYLFAFVAIAFLIIAGYQYLTAAGDEEKAKKGKSALIYSAVGMVIVVLSSAIVGLFEKLKPMESGKTTEAVTAFQTEVEKFLNALINGASFIAGTVAMLFLIIGAYLFITAAGDEEKAKKGKSSLVYSVIGLMVMVLARAIVGAFYKQTNPADPSSRITDVTEIKALIGSIIAFASSLIGALSVAMLIYAGFLWITAGGAEEQAGKAKKIIIYAVVGLALVIFSYAIVSIVITPNPT